jgi:hypothetical protein
MRDMGDEIVEVYGLGLLREGVEKYGDNLGTLRCVLAEVGMSKLLVNSYLSVTHVESDTRHSLGSDTAP